MAIKPCRECGSPISDKAEKCPICGVKQKSKTTVWAWIGVIVIVLCFIGTCTEKANKSKNQDSVESAPKPLESKSIQNWEYRQTKDEMRSLETNYATTVSTNKVNFSFPYKGGSELILTLREKSKDVDVIVNISKGQILCGIVNGCDIAFKFDDGPIQSISMSESDSHSSDVLFVMHDKTERRIIDQLKISKKLVIEIPFYQEGRKQFTFNVENLNWKY